MKIRIRCHARSSISKIGRIVGVCAGNKSFPKFIHSFYTEQDVHTAVLSSFVVIACCCCSAANRKPRYDDVYNTVEKCQSACLTEVPLCNAVNYIPWVYLRWLCRIWAKKLALRVVSSHSGECIFTMQCITCVFRKTSKLTAKQGRCQFEYCEKGYKYAQLKGFLSYINVDTNDNPMLPGMWAYRTTENKEKQQQQKRKWHS